MINVNTLTAGLGSPFLAPRGLPIKPAPVPADRAARTLIMSRARVFELEFPGIALQSLSLTFAVFLALWVLHGLGLIRVGRRLMVLTYTATAAIGLVYLASFALWLLGQRLPLIHEAGTGGILWMGFIVTVASLNLLVDFERIARLEGRLQPSYMPWFLGLGLMVTLVWLYLSVLRLLARIRR